MEPPIIAWEPNDMTIFDSVMAAESYVEPWWQAEPISIFDSAGRRLVVDVGKDRRITLREVESAKSDDHDLRAALLQYLQAVGVNADLNDRPTSELIALAR